MQITQFEYYRRRRNNFQLRSAFEVAQRRGLRSVYTLMERKVNQSKELNSSVPQENSDEKSPNGSADEPRNVLPYSPPSLSPLLPKALSAVLHARQTSPGMEPEPSPGRRSPPEHMSAPTLERLQSELRELREQFEQMKGQHNKEIQLLMNELDEEKRIRLTLQMEIQRMKKHMSK
ncbi:SH3 domain-containing kinase-binding protein 1 isoform X2 [Entelurus aequoreus]|uniref:SH3 domain-containing kinase-binding protein 1 isoform X2 n=1 Tax=Entelurus aequoreus TaxID=161455 RepID=UPI002B1E51A8|nr:SH3 domain-containing kinase-binding protein 1 isoform X2 [Entelurus aequoreus]